MNSEFAKLIAENSDDLQIHYDYSGRGMFGEKTTAIVGPIRAFVQAVADAGIELGESCEDNGQFSLAMGRLRFDTLGEEMVVY